MNEAAIFPFIDADPAQPGASLMPLLPLTLAQGRQEVWVSGLVDTGAAATLRVISGR